ncbi:MAG: type II secretion system F family protein [Lentisphaerota bacterium]
MPQFKYIARSKAGQRTEGTVEANDKRMAMMQVERMGLVPISVSDAAGAAAPAPAQKSAAKPAAAPSPAKPAESAANPAKKKRFHLELHRNKKVRMSIWDILLFTRELADLLASGMTLGKALHTLSKRKSSKGSDVLITELRDEIVQGSSLSDALSKRPDSFSHLYVSMVRAGEASGQLPLVLERLCTHYERMREAQSKVMSAILYPAIVMTMGVGTMIFTMIFVVPRFTAIFAELGSTLPLPTRILIGMSAGMIHYGWAIVIALVVLVIMLKQAIKTPVGRRRWNSLQLKMPIVKNIITANAFSNFARTLSTLLANGVQVLQALTIVEDTAGNVVIAEAIREARNKVTDGTTISSPLAAGGVFPPLLTDMLAVGEETGDLSGALSHIGNRYENELDRSVKMLTTVLEPIMILLMALLVGFVAVSMLLAVVEMTSGLDVN